MNFRAALNAIIDYRCSEVSGREIAQRKRANLVALMGVAAFSTRAMLYPLFFSERGLLLGLVSLGWALAFMCNFWVLRCGAALAARGGTLVCLMACAVCWVVLAGTRSNAQLYLIMVVPTAYYMFGTSRPAWRRGATLAALLVYGLCMTLPEIGMAHLPLRFVTFKAWVAVPEIILMLLISQTAFIRDIDRQEHELSLAARIDPLTNLLNRRAALELSTQLRETAVRERRVFALMMIDVDHFKQVNDRHGHAAGDLVLANTAATLQSRVRHADVLGRLGGEEFLVAASLESASHAMALAEDIRAAVALALTELHDGSVLACTVSIGVACAAGGEEALEQLMARADAALYDAKKQGRNRCAPGSLNAPD